MNSAQEEKSKQIASQIQQQQLQNQQSAADAEKAAAEEAEKTEYKNQVLRQILTPDAYERLSRIGLVKPEKRAQLEQFILGNWQRGARLVIDEATLVQFLEKLGTGLTEDKSSKFVHEGLNRKMKTEESIRKKIVDEDDVDLDDIE